MKNIKITKDDLFAESRRQGFDPDRWTHTYDPRRGYVIRKGFLEVGVLIFEHHAKLVVDAENKRGGN